MERIALSGSSGYLGRCLIERLRLEFPAATILGIDLRPPTEDTPHSCRPDMFVAADIASVMAAECLREFAPDTFIHAAFVLAPRHDEAQMRRINVAGGQAILQAAAQAGARRICMISSTTAFGPRTDHASPPYDDWSPVNSSNTFRYAADKAELEQWLPTFAAEHPHVRLSWVRPCLIAGPRMRNFLQRILLGPMVVLLDGRDPPLQLVHETDVAAAITLILARDAVGPFNIAPADSLRLSEIAELSNRRPLRLPLWLAHTIVGLLWTLRYPRIEYPPSLLPFLRDPWTASSRRLTDELGFHFQYSTRDALRVTLEAREQRRLSRR